MAASTCPRPAKASAEIVVGDRILRGAGQGVGPQGLAVPPVAVCCQAHTINPATISAETAAKGPTAIGPRTGRLRDAPGKRHVEPDLRQIRVAVGHRLIAHLHQPDHGHQCPKVPEPPKEQVRALPPCHEDGRGNHQQDRDRRNHFPGRRRVLGKGIEDGQTGRVEHFPEVGDVSHRGIGDPPGKGHLHQGLHGVALGGKRYRARGRSQNEQRDFFHEQTRGRDER